MGIDTADADLRDGSESPFNLTVFARSPLILNPYYFVVLSKLIYYTSYPIFALLIFTLFVLSPVLTMASRPYRDYKIVVITAI